MKYYCEYVSKIGNILLVSDGKYLIELKINNEVNKDWIKSDNLEVFQNAKKWLDDYFNKKESKINLPLKLNGTPFQQEVWKLLREIPYGSVVTYGDLAQKIALKKGISKMSSQAIGSAVHNNPIPIIVPCHRVVGVNHNLVGYGLGMDLKIELLKIESIDLKEYYFYENKKVTVQTRA